MSSIMERKPARPSHAMLGREHSHSAWVTNDLDCATEIFATRYGVADFSFIEGDMPSGGHIRVAFAWSGGQVLEIISATGPGSEFYNEMLPTSAFAIRFHHLGFVVHDEAGWRDLEADIEPVCQLPRFNRAICIFARIRKCSARRNNFRMQY